MDENIKAALRIARLHRAFGGDAYAANNVASGMADGGSINRNNYQMGGAPMPPAPNTMGAPQGQPMNNQPGNPMNSFGQQTQNGINGAPMRDMGYTAPPPFATLDNNLPPPQPVQAPVPSSYNPFMSNTPPMQMADGGIVDALRLARENQDRLPMRPYGPRYNPETNELNSRDLKDIGYYGPIRDREGGVATEYSGNIGNFTYPTIHKNMSDADLAATMMHETLNKPKYEGEDIISKRLNKAQPKIPFPEDVDQRAYEAAQQRLSEGRSPYYEPGKDEYPKWSPEQHWDEQVIMPRADGGVAEALEQTHGDHAIPLHQAIARHGYSTDGSVEGDVQFAPDENVKAQDNTSVDNTSVAQQEDESRERFLHKELEGSAPQYNPSYDRAIKAAAQYTPPGAFADAAGYLGNPSIKENLQAGRYVPAALQAAAVAMPLGFAGRKAATSGLKAGAEQLYKLGKSDIVGMPGYTAYKTVEDWAPQVMGHQTWNAAKQYGAHAAEAARQALGFAEGGSVQDQQRPYVNPNRQTKTPSSSSSTISTSTTTPKTSRPISPEEYNKGNLKGGEYVMAKGGAVEDALRIANRQHFRKGGMGYTLPPGIANNAKAMQAYISENIGKMSDLQRLEALQQAEAGNQKTDQSRALPVLNVMNRAAAGYNQFKGGSKANPEELSTIKGQMMAPRQFTSFTGQTPKNLQVGVNAIHRVLNNPNNPQVKSSADLVNRVASGQIPDFTNNSMYYATPGGAGKGFVQNLHRDPNVTNFGRAGAHVYAGDKNLSPVAKVNYPNVRDDLQRELAANKQAMAAERTPQASASPATPAAAPTPSATPDQMANRPQPFTPQQQAPVQAPNETSTQNFLKAQMANAPEPAQQPAAPVIPAQPPVAPSAPQQPEGSFGVDFKESKAEQPPTMGTPPVAEAPKPPEPEQMAAAQDEPIAKPMNPQGPEAPEPMAAQAEAPEPMMPEQPDNMDMAGDMGGGFDMAAYGGAIKPHYEYSDGGEVGKRLQDHALRLSRKGYDEGGSLDDLNNGGLGHSVEFAQAPARPTLEQKFPQKNEPFDVLPLTETNTGIHFDPKAGLAGPITKGLKIAHQAAPSWMGGEGKFDPNNPEDFKAVQDLAGTALGSGTVFNRAPKGAIGMFVSAHPKDPLVEEALRLANRGASPADVYERTGLTQGSTGIWHHDVPTHDLGLTREAETKLKNEGKFTGKYGELIEAPTLYEKAPELIEAPVEINYNKMRYHPDLGKNLAQTVPGENPKIQINTHRLDRSSSEYDPARPFNLLDTAVHEGTHYVADARGEPGGGTPEYFRERNLAGMLSPYTYEYKKTKDSKYLTPSEKEKDILPEIVKMEMERKNIPNAKFPDVVKILSEQPEDYINFLRYAFNRKKPDDTIRSPHEAYKRLENEAFARSGEQRRTFTPSQIRQTLPQETFAQTEGEVPWNELYPQFGNWWKNRE